MYLTFEKWHGCLNDFIVVWTTDADSDLVIGSLKRQAVKLCDRHGGIGADGLLILQSARRDDLTPERLTIVNSDGSLAKNCGNGLRCAASSVLKRHRDKGDPKDLPEIVELTVEGVAMTSRFMKTDATYPLVAVDMGIPHLGNNVPWHDAAISAVKQVAQMIGEPDLATDVAVCEIGNPHIVITTDKASRELMLKVGPALQKNAAWDGVNVHLVKPASVSDRDQARAGQELGQRLNELCTVYVWERGAGETMACGSGACAIAAAAFHTGLSDRDGWFGVDMPGGRLYVRQAEDSEPALLAGPAAFVYSGTIEI